MTNQTHDRPRHAHPTRWPLPPLLATATLLVALAATLALTAPTGRGTPQAATGPLRAGDPGRLDAAQARLARAQATADRFAVAFGDYLAGTTPPRHLRTSGASASLVARIAQTPPSRAEGSPHRSPGPGLSSSAPSRRSGDHRGTHATGPALAVSVLPHGTGWLASATLAAPGAPSIPVTFRLENHAGRAVVVDVNAGGRE